MRLRDYVIDAIVDYFRLMVFALVTLTAAIMIDIIRFGSVGPTSLVWLIILGLIVAGVVQGYSMDFYLGRLRRRV